MAAEVTSGHGLELTILLNQVVWVKGPGAKLWLVPPETGANPAIALVLDDSQTYV